MKRLASFFDGLVEEDGEEVVGLLQDVLENLPDAAFIITSSAREILWCNAAVERCFGYRREEMIGKSTALLHIDDKRFREFGRRFQAAVGNGEAFRGRFWMKSKCGRQIPTEHLITPLRRAGGNSVNVLIVRRPAEPSQALAPGYYDRLTEREREVFEATARGLSAREIASLFEISPRTVELHRAHVLEKLEMGSIRELMAKLWEAAKGSGGLSSA